LDAKAPKPPETSETPEAPEAPRAGGGWIRPAVLLAFALFMGGTGWRHQQLGGGPGGAPPVDALCPLGGLEGLWTALSAGEFLRRTGPSVLVLLAAVGIGSLLFHRTFCGWICPLGAIQEGLTRAARRLGLRPRELPEPADRPLRLLKYGILAGITLWAWATGTLAWRDLDPWVAVMHLPAGLSALEESPGAYAVLALLVLLPTLRIERFWCRYLCPLGALTALFSRFSLSRVVRDEGTCVRCGACDRACPVRLAPLATAEVRSVECLACGRCVRACPVPGALSFQARFLPGRRLSAALLGLSGVALFLAFYGGARATGLWNTRTPPAERAADPAEAIYGWMTLEQAASAVRLPVERLIGLGGLSPDVSRDVPLKRLPGVDDEAFRARVGAALRAEGGDGPAGASGTPGPTAPEGGEGATGTAPEGTSPPDPSEIRGTATLAEVARTYGLDPAAILKEAGWPADADPARPLREIAREAGREVSDLREAVRRLRK